MAKKKTKASKRYGSKEETKDLLKIASALRDAKPKKKPAIPGEIGLGDEARDKISGFTGIITSMHAFMNGCIRIVLSPQDKTKADEMIHPAFDIQQIELLAKNPLDFKVPWVMVLPEPKANAALPPPGGDRYVQIESNAIPPEMLR